MAESMYQSKKQDRQTDTSLQRKSGAVLQDNRALSPSIAQLKPNKTGLPDSLKSGIESLSGMSMDHVKVHYNSPQPAQLNALAYAQGTDIHVAPGQEKHLPHEAWHVVQQAQGRVRPTMQMKDSAAINDDKGLEKEADVMGRKAVQMQTSMRNAKHTASSVSESGNTQKNINSSILQLIAVGMIPRHSVNWRLHVNTNDNGATGTEGDEPFSDGQKTMVRNNNIANAAGNAPVLAAGAGNYPISDDSNGALLTRQEATALSPEVDHIVPRADQGANDLENARVLSQGENNGHVPLALGRPGRINQRMRVYRNINIDRDMGAPNYVPNNQNIAAGSLLTLPQIKSLIWYSTGAAVPATYADITNAMIVGILNAGPGNANDVTVA